MTHPTHGFPDSLVSAALRSARALPQAVPVWGLSALQGTGKSTLAAQLAQAAQREGLRSAVLSLDDFYLTRAARQALARQVHPLLVTRGPPGTHDLPLALHTLQALREGRPVALPRFDKLADDRAAESTWPRLDGPVDLVIFDGWCLGTPAQAQAALVAPINALERDEDRDATWRSHCNAALARDYPALWRDLRRAVVPAAAGLRACRGLALAGRKRPAGRASRAQRHDPPAAGALRPALRACQPPGAAHPADAGRPRGPRGRAAAGDRRLRPQFRLQRPWPARARRQYHPER
ncbi:uridine kinase [Pseudoxanthomonas winnipegensis]|nr:uridine kinase [Pseudoxanthomonas winnipegensis]